MCDLCQDYDYHASKIITIDNKKIKISVGETFSGRHNLPPPIENDLAYFILFSYLIDDICCGSIWKYALKNSIGNTDGSTNINNEIKLFLIRNFNTLSEEGNILLNRFQELQHFL